MIVLESDIKWVNFSLDIHKDQRYQHTIANLIESAASLSQHKNFIYVIILKIYQHRST
jgi:hypothetical protein